MRRIDSATGVLTWAPTLADAGMHSVEVYVRDETSLVSEPQSFDIVVTGDSQPPVVLIEHGPDPVILGDLVTLHVTATDDDMAAIEGLTVDGVNVPLDPSGMGVWTATAAGRFDAAASAVDPSAVDPSGSRGFADAQIRVLDPNDTDAPFVELTAPAADDILTYLHDATGTVRDDNLYRWWLDMRPADRGGFRTMLTGTNGVESASLGELDVTQLPRSAELRSAEPRPAEPARAPRGTK